MFAILQLRSLRKPAFTQQLFMAFLVLLSLGNAKVPDLLLRGRVVDERARPVPFASVTIKGTHTAVQTEADGAFQLNVKHVPATILYSAIGFETEEKIITAKDFKDSFANFIIILKSSESKLEEVVIVGYADTRKRSSLAPMRTSSTPKGKAAGVISSAAPGVITRYKTGIAFDAHDVAGSERKKEGGSFYTKASPTVNRTSLLTAGEVNDFRKWKMWEDYNETDFKMFAADWRLYATRRYTVQLQNNDFKALAGRRVFLVDKQHGDTVWAAVSDNTGKAELWNGFSNLQQGNDLTLLVEEETRQFPAIPFTQGINKIVLNRNCTVSNKVEIAFVVDATGSMQDEIEYLKVELEDILTKVAAKDPALDLHTGSVFYRDKGDAYVTLIQPLTPGISNTIRFIKNQNADGGGDFPEALKEALQEATLKLKWSADARAKIIFLLMDAPPHDEAKTEMASLISRAAAIGIRIVPVACSGTDKATEFIMRSMALGTNGTYLFLTDDSGIGNPHIKPTTDEFKVELLNVLMQRTIEQMCFVNDCSGNGTRTVPLTTYTNIENVKLFPNPTKGPVELQTALELREIFVADFTGKILLRQEMKGKPGRYNLDLSAFPSATYFIRYTTTQNKTGAEKLVVAR
jgi:hypothetical protein